MLVKAANCLSASVDTAMGRLSVKVRAGSRACCNAETDALSLKWSVVLNGPRCASRGQNMQAIRHRPCAELEN